MSKALLLLFLWHAIWLRNWKWCRLALFCVVLLTPVAFVLLLHTSFEEVNYYERSRLIAICWASFVLICSNETDWMGELKVYVKTFWHLVESVGSWSISAVTVAAKEKREELAAVTRPQCGSESEFVKDFHQEEDDRKPSSVWVRRNEKKPPIGISQSRNQPQKPQCLHTLATTDFFFEISGSSVCVVMFVFSRKFSWSWLFSHEIEPTWGLSEIWEISHLQCCCCFCLLCAIGGNIRLFST